MNNPTLDSELAHRLVTLSTGQRGLRAPLPVQVSVPTDTTEPVIDIRASDETLDRYGEIISAKGWRLENYRNNPVIQNAHQYGDVIFTLGKAIRTEVAGSALVAGTADGVLNHTVSGVDWQNLWFNGTLVGETGINAALCGTWGCPVLLVTGDRAAAREAKALLGDGLTTVEVKQGLGARTARLLPPKRARQLVEEGAKRALSDLNAVPPYDPGKPCEIKVEYKSTAPPQKLRFQPGVEPVDDRTIVSRANDWWSAWKQFFFAAG